MTAHDKETIYTLLQTASAAFHGYRTPAFSGGMPHFQDDPASPVSGSIQAQPATAAAPAGQDALASIAEKIARCNRCDLCKTRSRTVPGMGVKNPLVVVIGEGPGHDEDLQGLPFVGAAGQLLDKMLAAIGISRSTNCYICNIVKCRPPQNRTPLPEEAEACASFLQAQLSVLKPKMILCVGSTAAKNLLHTQDGVTRLRGNFYEWQTIPVAVTYHPSALLRDAALKRPAWEDLQRFRDRLLTIAPDYMTTAQIQR